MPTSKDPFTTVVDRGGRLPGSATVIRKGSPYGKRFAKEVQGVEGRYEAEDTRTGNILKKDFPVANARINRAAARKRGADVVAGAAKDIGAGRMKVSDMSGQDERTKYAK